MLLAAQEMHRLFVLLTMITSGPGVTETMGSLVEGDLMAVRSRSKSNPYLVIFNIKSSYTVPIKSLEALCSLLNFFRRIFYGYEGKKRVHSIDLTLKYL